jgi:hypothetical protein
VKAPELDAEPLDVEAPLVMRQTINSSKARRILPLLLAARCRADDARTASFLLGFCALAGRSKLRRDRCRACNTREISMAVFPARRRSLLHGIAIRIAALATPSVTRHPR